MSLSLYEKVKLFTPVPFIANSREQKAAVKISRILNDGVNVEQLTGKVIDGYLAGKGDDKKKVKKLAIVAAKVGDGWFSEALLEKVNGSRISRDAIQEGIGQAHGHYQSKKAMRGWAGATAGLMGAGIITGIFIHPVLLGALPGYFCAVSALARTGKKTMAKRSLELSALAQRAENLTPRQLLCNEDGVPLRLEVEPIALKKSDGTIELYIHKEGDKYRLIREFKPDETVPDVLNCDGRQIQPRFVDQNEDKAECQSDGAG